MIYQAAIQHFYMQQVVVMNSTTGPSECDAIGNCPFLEVPLILYVRTHSMPKRK
jgi:hypothetical protein